MKIPFPPFLLFSLLMVGCAIGPDYERPAISQPEEFRNQTAGALDTHSLADTPWWELFHDEALQILIRTALEENNDLLLAMARIDEARAELGITRSGLFPRLEGKGSFSKRRIPGTLIPGTSQSTDLTSEIYNLGGALSWELDLWGRIRRATEASRARLLATQEARRAITIQLVSQVAQTYFELRAFDLELAITRRTVATREKTFKIVSFRHEEGLVSGLDKAKSEAEVVKVASQIPDLERQIVQTENALSILLGQNPTGILRGHTLTDQATPPIIPAGLPSALLERRPDILQAEQNLVAANAEIGVAKGNFFPRFTLTGDFGTMSRDFNDLFTGPAKFWGIGPGVTLPFFTAGRNMANLDATEARQQQALIQYQQTILEAFREVEDALIAYQKFRLMRTQKKKLVKLNRHAVELSEARYEEGLADYLDVLDSQRELFTAELDLTQMQRAQLVAVVRLYKALGGGWNPESDPGYGNVRAPSPLKLM
jgi:multidrug efflux system outer membrane protein